MGGCINKEPLSELMSNKLLPTAVVECAPENTIVVPLDFKPPRNPRSAGAVLYNWDVASADNLTRLDALRQKGFDFADTEYGGLTIWRKLKAQYNLKTQSSEVMDRSASQ